MGLFKKKNEFPYEQLRNLIVGKLKELNCLPEINENEDVAFTYQGEHFIITIENKGSFSIYDLWWLSIDLEDENASILFNAIKEVNTYSTYTLTYKLDENVAHVASRYRMILSFDEYDNPILSINALGFVLGEAFSAQRYLRNEFGKLRNSEQ